MEKLSGKRVTVAGLGRFGGNIAASRWLVEQGAHVTVTDMAMAEKLADSVKQLDGLPITWRLGEHREKDFTDADLVVASPAIPTTNRYLQAATQAGVPVTTEIRLVVERCPATIVGVTGTKGKSTTTALLGEMLKTRHTTWVGGNIGGSLLFDLPKMKKTDVVLLELSSYMLEHLGALRWSPHVALVTMITADHLEWHGSFEKYVRAKANILAYQKPTDYAIMPEDNRPALTMADMTQGRVVLFGLKGRRRFELALPGEHNQLNAQGAFAAAQVMGVTWDDAQRAIRDFTGLPHRLQLVHTNDGVRYVNDSIATIPESAVMALDCFPRGRVIQIVGGADKHLDMTLLTAALADRAKAVLTIGRLGPELARQTRAAGAKDVAECGDLATAVARAKQIAVQGDVVLLSTGCASYDQFTNFEQRGDTFARLARER
ncbi:MAG TPA: UDP-N-acetylmuramoyl-L-alanine--D-glutamate ligase [Tepidisphaeraceae bacterium]|nr:UDP-N-acetylmuramoyl-L-alanine--D-glutamate ligase [Tepidisphaeraceae bacterium]